MGAIDGGLNIPHSEKRFIGFDKRSKTHDSEKMKAYIFGGHVSEFMEELWNEEPDAFRRLFSKYIEHRMKHTDLEDCYKQVHEAIRADPTRKTAHKKREERRKRRPAKQSFEQRKKALASKIARLREI